MLSSETEDKGYEPDDAVRLEKAARKRLASQP